MHQMNNNIDTINVGPCAISQNLGYYIFYFDMEPELDIKPAQTLGSLPVWFLADIHINTPWKSIVYRPST